MNITLGLYSRDQGGEDSFMNLLCQISIVWLWSKWGWLSFVGEATPNSSIGIFSRHPISYSVHSCGIWRAMDDSAVRSHIEQLRYVPEESSGLEIMLHTVGLAPGADN